MVVDKARTEYEPVDAAAQLPWRTALLGDGMPAHQYVVFGAMDRQGIPLAMEEPECRHAVEVLLTAIRSHPDAYDAYFRGYRWPMRYLELSDGRRYWRTVLRGTHMLNRCTLDSVEPPRRVDQGGEPIEWEGPPWAPFGSPWPPGYEEINGTWFYNDSLDWRRHYRCGACGTKYMPIPADRPCPRCDVRPPGP